MNTKTKTKKDVPECACGCGHRTDNTFVQGHDSKLHSLVLRIARGEARISELPKSERTRSYLSDAPWMTRALRRALGLVPARKAA